MITIIYPYRNRELQRVKRSLDSLSQQSNLDFEVVFVDYGSDLAMADQVKQLISEYQFARYVYTYHLGQPWSRARTINIGIREAKTDFVFMADIDMIFHPNLIKRLNELKDTTKTTYFKVGFLTEDESQKEQAFEKYIISFESKEGAAGLSLFPRKALLDINGFEEFFHFWGAEDNNIHARLKANGLTSVFYQDEILMLHQWHPIYRAGEETLLTKEHRVKGITRINQRLNEVQINQKKTISNLQQDWGVVICKEDFLRLDQIDEEYEMTSKKEAIDSMLYGLLGSLKETTLKITVTDSIAIETPKQRLKKWVKGAANDTYTLKEVNDMLLLHLISHYRNSPYIYQVSDDLKSIQLTIRL